MERKESIKHSSVQTILTTDFDMNTMFAQPKLLFMQDRILIDLLLTKESSVLNKINCIIIDEVHERTINIDLLISRLKTIR